MKRHIVAPAPAGLSEFEQLVRSYRNRNQSTHEVAWNWAFRARPDLLGLPGRPTDPVTVLRNRLQLEDGLTFTEAHERATREVLVNGRAKAAPESLLLNRAFSMSQDGWIEIVRTGEFPHPSGVVQVIDAPALGSMLHLFDLDRAKSNFPGLLIDFDHFSYDTDKSSEAAGWIGEMRIDGDRLLARPDWTEAGERAVTSGRYRLVSPTFDATQAEKLGEKRVRPLRLDTVALTNSPNIRGGAPLST